MINSHLATTGIETDRVLRAGVMCNGRTLEEWQWKCLDNLLKLGYVRLELLIIDDGSWSSSLSLKKTPLSRWIYIFFRRTWFKKPPRRHVDASKLFSGVTRVHPKITLKGRWSQYFDEESLEVIRSHGLDFILRFGFNIVRGEILRVAPYGVWSFHHDNEMKYRGSPSGFWEIYKNDPVSGAVLQRLTEKLDGGIILRRGYLNTLDYSYNENIRAVFEESATWPAQVCRDICRGNADYLSRSPTPSKAPIYYPPGNLAMIIFFGKLVRNKLRRWFFERFKTSQWNIGIVHDRIERFVDSSYQPMIVWLPPPPKGKFLADPFEGIRSGNNHFLCEYYDYSEDKANISCIYVSENGKPKANEIRTAIVESTHMSYPYTIVSDGKLYCVPEIWQANEIALYKAGEMPYHWKRAGTLIENIAAVDPTLFRHNGRWWLMCTDRHWGSKYNLFIFYAEDLFGPWLPHERNPVKTDIRSSRPAGTPFSFKGRLYRPAQDCSRSYGGRIVLNRINHLSKKDFEEITVSCIEPVKPYKEGIHTLSQWGEKTLVDGKRSRFLWQV